MGHPKKIGIEPIWALRATSGPAGGGPTRTTPGIERANWAHWACLLCFPHDRVEG